MKKFFLLVYINNLYYDLIAYFNNIYMSAYYRFFIAILSTKSRISIYNSFLKRSKKLKDIRIAAHVPTPLLLKKTNTVFLIRHNFRQRVFSKPTLSL